MGKAKYLVLLDMNGTVCYRSENPVPGVRREDLYTRRKYYYTRIGVRDFVAKLKDAGFDVVVYSSMMRHNIEAGLNAVLPGYHGLLRTVMDRDMNKPDPNAEKEWDTSRDMTKVWKALPEYGPTNTVLLDNEARKFIETPRNGIVVPEYGPAEVRTKKAGTLDGLLRYLQDMAAAAPDDVRDYMEDHPFHAATPAVPVRSSRPAGAAATAAAAEPSINLSYHMAKMALSGRSNPTDAAPAEAGGALKPPTPEKGDIGSKGQKPHDKSEEGTQSPANRTKSEHSAVALPPVPQGTVLHFVCVDDGRFTLSNMEHDLSVSGPTSAGLRIDHKMGYHRLLEESQQAGVELLVVYKDEEYRLPASASPSVPKS